MKFLILNTDYSEFLRWLYAQHPGLGEQPYGEQVLVRNKSLFGVADFYSSNLRKLGHEEWDIHANNEFMQKAWVKKYPYGISSHFFVCCYVNWITSNSGLRYFSSADQILQIRYSTESGDGWHQYQLSVRDETICTIASETDCVTIAARERFWCL